MEGEYVRNSRPRATEGSTKIRIDYRAQWDKVFETEAKRIGAEKLRNHLAQAARAFAQAARPNIRLICEQSNAAAKRAFETWLDVKQSLPAQEFKTIVRRNKRKDPRATGTINGMPSSDMEPRTNQMIRHQTNDGQTVAITFEEPVRVETMITNEAPLHTSTGMRKRERTEVETGDQITHSLPEDNPGVKRRDEDTPTGEVIETSLIVL